MILKSGYRFPACAKPKHMFVVSFDSSAGEGRSGKIMLKHNAISLEPPKRARTIGVSRLGASAV
jgi:hypothetical protein